MMVGQIRIPISMWQIEEVLDKRVGEQKLNIDDLFMVWCSEAAVPNPGFYDTQIETKYGKLRFFFTPDCPVGKTYILHKKKFEYPRKGTSAFTKDGDLIN